MRCLIDLKLLVLAIVGLPAALGIFVSPAAVAEDQTGSKSPADVRAVRENLMDIMGTYERILERYKLDDELLGSLIEAEQHMESMSDEDLALVAEAIAPELAKMHRLVGKLEDILLTDRAVRRTASSPGWPGGPEGPPIDYPYLGNGEFVFGWADDPDPTEGTCTGGLDHGASCHANSDCRNCEPDTGCEGGDIGRCGGQDEDPTNEDEFYLCRGSLRANANARYTTLITFIVMEGVRDIAGRFCDQQFAGFSCNVCCIPVDILYQITHFFYESFELCDDLIDSAEIEGSFDRLGHFHDDWTDKFPYNVLPDDFRSGYGCNGIDDDGFFGIDDCGEDVFGPMVHIDAAVSLPWFRTTTEGMEAVERAGFAQDDCTNIEDFSFSFIPDACGFTANLFASDSCTNSNTISTFVKVDGTPPSVAINGGLPACFDSVEAAEMTVLDATSISDVCTAQGDLDVRVNSTVTECGLRVRVEATDLAGNWASDAVTVRMDNVPPDIKINSAVRLTCYDSPEDAAEAIALAVEASDNCGGDVTIGDPVLVGIECDVVVEVSATDACGNSSTAATVVTIDDEGGEITIDPSVNAEGICYTSVLDAEQAVFAATTFEDNCTLEENLSIKVGSAVTECSLRVRLDVVDDCGKETTEAVTVRVDTQPPRTEIQKLLLGFRGEPLGFQSPPCFSSVKAAEAAVLAATRFSDNCTGNPNLNTSVSSSGDPCSLQVTSKAVDECLIENTDTVTVRVDPILPVVTCAVAVATMSPPNHTMRNVGFTFAATDNCTGEPEIEIFITSDETTASASGTGQTSPAPDAFILRDLDGVFQGILLRAERSTRGDGRVYEITVRATDECGNVGECSANVSVSPANGQPATDSGQFFDATEVN